MDQNQGQRRGHFHRGRRGPDRRGVDRRQPPAPQQERTGAGQVDVEQIMREIRGRIAQRQGIDLSNQQIQDLAARRLESILDPRAIKPSLLDALRRSAGAQAQRAAEKIPNEPAFSFEDTTIYDSHRGAMRFIRRLLNPILKLFFNPNPLIRALHIQAKLNVEAAEREAERDRRQTEWNALHYEIVQRLVTEVSRASLELQALSLRVESLDAKVDFNERRVRGIEGSVHRARPQSVPGRPADHPAAPAGVADADTEPEVAATGSEGPQGQLAADGAKRRRRRRRGRRSGTGHAEGQQIGGGMRPDAGPAQISPGEPASQSEEPAGPASDVATVPLERALVGPPEPAPAPVFQNAAQEGFAPPEPRTVAESTAPPETVGTPDAATAPPSEVDRHEH
jgi:hypothetical protein